MFAVSPDVWWPCWFSARGELSKARLIGVLTVRALKLPTLLN